MQEIEVGTYQSLSIGRTSKFIPLPYPRKGCVCVCVWGGGGEGCVCVCGGGGAVGLMEPPPKIFTLLMLHSEIILN